MPASYFIVQEIIVPKTIIPDWLRGKRPRMSDTQRLCEVIKEEHGKHISTNEGRIGTLLLPPSTAS
jgi:hypothetical protein